MTTKTYIIAQADGQAIKIGKAKNPTARLRELQVGHSQKLRLLGTIEEDCERELHIQFKGKRITGEWFKWDDEILAWFAADKRIQRCFDPNAEAEKYSKSDAESRRESLGDREILNGLRCCERCRMVKLEGVESEDLETQIEEVARFLEASIESEFGGHGEEQEDEDGEIFIEECTEDEPCGPCAVGEEVRGALSELIRARVRIFVICDRGVTCTIRIAIAGPGDRGRRAVWNACADFFELVDRFCSVEFFVVESWWPFEARFATAIYANAYSRKYGNLTQEKVAVMMELHRIKDTRAVVDQAIQDLDDGLPTSQQLGPNIEVP